MFDVQADTKLCNTQTAIRTRDYTILLYSLQEFDTDIGLYVYDFDNILCFLFQMNLSMTTSSRNMALDKVSITT